MSTVNTIRGPIDSSELGRTLSHEHLTNGFSGMERIAGLLPRTEMVGRNLDALDRVKAAGIDSIVDCTPWDLGRQMWLFEAVAERSPVHVVCATGVYRWVPPIYWGMDPDEIARIWIAEAEEGIEGTGIRAGIIKLAWDMEYQLTEGRVSPRQVMELTARAAARTARHAGTPITCHTRAVDELGTPLLDIFEDEGLDLAAVTIGHSNDTQDLDYLCGLAARGANVGLDRFFSTNEDYVAERGGVALGLAQAGYAGQTSLGHDGTPAGLWGRWREEPNPGVWTLVPEHEVPWLLEHGASEADVEAMLAGSIRRTFEAAAGMAGKA
jgi:phosphotriesterase-related protein